MPVAMDMGFKDLRAFAPDSAGAFKPLRWPDLCARLAAAQDLRRARACAAGIAHGGVIDRYGTASFHGPAATLLLQDESRGDRDIEQAVNPMPSANGKVVGDISGDIGEIPFTSPSDALSSRVLP